MNYRQLPLNGLRTLEACARTGSLTKAAEELSVTPSAVRYQIRLLENLTGNALFDRNGPKITPTRHTLAALPDLQIGLEALQRGFDTLGSDTRNDLNIVVDVSFASLWLVPLIGEFEALLPDIRVNLLSPISGASPKNTQADIIVTAHPGADRDQGIALPPETFLPLAACGAHAPALLTIEPLHAQDTYPNWNLWQAKYGRLEATQRRYSWAMLAIQAAKSGEGLVLSSTLLALGDLREGLLHCPDGHCTKGMQSSRWLFIQKPNRMETQVFAEWIQKKFSAACKEAAALIG